MDCPRRWTAVAIIIHLSVQETTVFCQNVVLGETPGNVLVRDNKEFSKLLGNPTSTELYTSILTAAASNGVLSDLLPMLQGQPILDNFNRYSQDVLTKPLSVLPMSSSGCTQEPIVISSQAIRPPTTNQNFIVTTPLPCGSGYAPNTIPSLSQSVSSPALPLSNCIQQIAQPVPLENYSVCAQNTGAILPMPIVLQPQCQFNELNPYNVYNQIFEPVKLSELNSQPANLPMIPPSQVLPIINTCSGPQDISSNVGSLCLPPPTVFTSDGQQLPLNLQINVPTPSAPAPRITVVSASPTNTPSSAPSDFSTNLPQFQYPPPTPIIVGSSKSSWRNLLPIVLVALLSDRGCNNGDGCCCCSCNCGNSANNIPIPYPIPIPVNNPIINTCPYPYSSRNREHRDDGEDDEDWKRK